MGRAMTIGRLAKSAGVGVETIRYYQRRGILKTPAKPAGRPRYYADAMVGRIAFVRRAQHLGFSLEEIRAMLEIADGVSCAEGSGFARSKYEQLSQRVKELNRMRRELRGLLRRCEAERGGPCPFIRFLSGDET